jgi:hypothetical protein
MRGAPRINREKQAGERNGSLLARKSNEYAESIPMLAVQFILARNATAPAHRQKRFRDKRFHHSNVGHALESKRLPY